jgi:hypothetical protein
MMPKTSIAYGGMLPDIIHLCRLISNDEHTVLQ